MMIRRSVRHTMLISTSMLRKAVTATAAGLVALAVLIPSGAAPQAQTRARAPRDTVRLIPPILDTALLRSGELVPGRGVRVRVMSGHLRPEVMEAEQLMDQQRFQDAINLLTPIWDSTPSPSRDDPVASSLKRAHRGLKDYGGVFRVLHKQLSAQPGDPLLLSELADTYFAADAADSAAAVLRQLIAASPEDPSRYQLAAESYMRSGRTNDGVATYRAGRARIGDSAIFAENLARILEARREYTGAISEYFRWLGAQPDAGAVVQREVTTLIKISEAADQVTAALRKIVIASPKNEFAHALYGDLLAESGQLDSAFAEYRRADLLASQPGKHRRAGIERCLETRHYREARDEAIAFLQDYPGHPDGIRVWLARGRAELALGQPFVAADLLKELMGQMPDLPERTRIAYEVGEIYRLHTDRQDSAQVYFRRVVEHPGRVPERAVALLRLGEIAIHDGSLVRADSIFQQAGGENPTPPLEEEIAFRRGELLFFTGAYDECSAHLTELVKRFPRGMFVNDALELSLMLKENKDAMNWSLNRYAAGMLAARRGQTDSALAYLATLAGDSANSLADEAIFQEGLLYTAIGRPQDAGAAYRNLIARYPDCFLVPRAWVRLGELYAGPLADLAQARAAYQTVLTDFQDSPLVEEARRRLQALPSP
ncbi:MAG: tetratricopeptide repeat protein [Candidatus Zixiibacteriota bacterium]